MKIQKTNNDGFTLVEILFLIVIVLVIVVAGFYVANYNNKKSVSTSNSNTVKTNVTNETSSAHRLSLASGKITFTIPTGWSVNTNNPNTSSTLYCQLDSAGPANFANTCIDGYFISPSNPTEENSEDEYYGPGYTFGVSISAYKLTDGSSPSNWFENDFSGPAPLVSEGDITSSKPINGYKAYYLEQNTNSSLTSSKQSYIDVYFVIVDDNDVALIYSRISDSIINSDGQNTTNNLSYYLPAITSLVDSIKFN